jgi:hypothetical protein
MWLGLVAGLEEDAVTTAGLFALAVERMKHAQLLVINDSDDVSPKRLSDLQDASLVKRCRVNHKPRRPHAIIFTTPSLCHRCHLSHHQSEQSSVVCGFGKSVMEAQGISSSSGPVGHVHHALVNSHAEGSWNASHL